ncbi:MAG: malate synthase A [Acidobacteria bacterium]|nr:malate synthase A [Acidobacteriota bacterium]
MSTIEFQRNVDAYADILTPEAVAFVAKLARRFESRRQELLAARRERQKELLEGKLPGFLPETADIRAGDWKITPEPADVLDRRVEITGPVDRKMIINALNSGASVFMADFEDANSPTFDNNMQGQRNLADAIRGTISFASPEGKSYRLNDKVATLFVRPRGWHLNERNLKIDGVPCSGSLFDFGLYFFRNAAERRARGTGIYLYLPKLESHKEARLWADVFNFAEDELGMPRGLARGTVLIETILAAFEMDEILYELREHSLGLNCGRWDYIFSYIKKLGHRRELMLPDRAQVTMDRDFLKSYVDLLIQTCHRRGAHAMGGMAAQIPIKNNPEANDAAMAKVRADKLREVKAGHDGTWVAHPGLVPVAMEIFNEHMPGPNQLGVMRGEVSVSETDLLKPHQGTITDAGLRLNIDVGLQYLASWLGGQGCVPIYNLMEDAATAEISRSQVWQWIHNGVPTSDGQAVTIERVRGILEGLVASSPHPRAREAGEILDRLMTAPQFTEFLTLPAYEILE